MNEIILLGAGASKEANLPDSSEMTKKIIDKFQESYQYTRFERIANYVIGGILFEEGKKGNNPLSCKINVEDFFNSVLILAERNALEVAPFISSWHPMVEELDRLAPNSARLNEFLKEIFEDFKSMLSPPDQKEMPNDIITSNQEVYHSLSLPQTVTPSVSELTTYNSHYNSHLVSAGWLSEYTNHLTSFWDSPDTHNFLTTPYSTTPTYMKKEPRKINGYFFQQAIEESQPKPGNGQIFQEMAESMIRILTDILWVKEANLVGYLVPLVNLARDRDRLVIATLNYDNSIELASNSQDIACNIGIESWSGTGSFDILDNCVNLLKLHGSIDWRWNPNITTENRPLPHSTVERIMPQNIKDINFKDRYSKPAILFGHKNKLTAEGPFLDLLRTFKSELMRKDTKLLTIIGYSFGDIHINTYITQWLYQNLDHCIRVIDPSFNNNMKEYALNLKAFKELRPKQVKIFNQKASKAIKRLYSD